MTASQASFAARLDAHARSVMPPERLTTHPLTGIVGGCGQVPSPTEVMLIDLFTLLFCVHGAAPEGDVRPEDLYRDRALLSAVDDVMAPWRHLVGDQVADPTDAHFVARAFGTAG